MDVALIRWPAEEDRRVELEGLQKARLLLVEPGAEPPLCTDSREDWVRLPASHADTRARVDALLVRVDALESQLPILAEGGILEYRSAQAELSPLQTRIAALLVGRFEAVVSRDEIADRAWPGAGPSQNTIDVNLARLRRQVRLIGLTVRTVRSRGYMLCPADTEPWG